VLYAAVTSKCRGIDRLRWDVSCVLCWRRLWRKSNRLN